MKLVHSLMLGASLVCAAALPAVAAPLPLANTTTDLGVFTGQPGDDSAGLGRMVPPGTFMDTYTFSTISTDLISASITNSYTHTNQIIDPFTLTLYSGSPLTGGTKLASATATSSFFGFESGGFAPVTQAAGQFYLVVSGTTKDDPTYGGSLALSVSSVPLPASAPMFGAALVALGAVGYGMKRKKAAAAA